MKKEKRTKNFSELRHYLWTKGWLKNGTGASKTMEDEMMGLLGVALAEAASAGNIRDLEALLIAAKLSGVVIVTQAPHSPRNLPPMLTKSLVGDMGPDLQKFTEPRKKALWKESVQKGPRKFRRWAFTPSTKNKSFRNTIRGY